MPKVYAQVHGCPSNTADYEVSLGLLKQAGFETADSPEKSDINMLFTCTVKKASLQRMINIIRKLSSTKKPLIVAGCMPKTEYRMIEKIAPNASVVGPDSIGHIADAARAAMGGNKAVFVADSGKAKTGFPRVRKERNVGIIVASSGCLSDCSYCSVKFARGKLRSCPIGELVKEAETLVKDGCDELQITSQDNSCYGLDIGTDIAELVKAVSAVPGDFKIRVGMMNPTHIRDKKLLAELIAAYKNPKVSKFLHVPVQSGSDRILKLMKRGYAVADFEKIVTAFRKEIPNIYISTDIIVGFPNEQNSDFELTVGLVKRMKFDKVNLSKFGARPGTEASKMGQLGTETINERSKILHGLIKIQNQSLD
ncbi:MAG: tRNA (N(6)-L-threonylcarbamoyladenosine(37)-C(2))-methylthiotransferase [Candidatus Aenigmatarchaeota archaeon]